MDAFGAFATLAFAEIAAADSQAVEGTIVTVVDLDGIEADEYLIEIFALQR